MTERFGPPGELPDFDGIRYQREAWDVAMASYFVHGVKRTEALLGRGHSQFFDPTRRRITGGLTEQTITWNGFPKALAEEDNPYRAADELRSGRLDGHLIRFRPQDEYLEWHATTKGGKIVAVDFTCEGPEYWTALAHGYPDDLHLPTGHPPASGDFGTVVRLYRRYVSTRVRPEDLLDGSRRYDPHNKWNTSHGAMHLTHPSNSLSAEVFLAADASVVRRRRGGPILEDDDELIRCAEYGEPRRASDPTIGGAVNALARAGGLIGLKNPVGLYINSLDTTGWSKPDGSPVGDYWHVLRGDSSTGIVRARYEVPPSEGFTVSDIKIGGEPIEYAGQIAEHITMKLTGVAAEIGQHHADPVGCADELRSAQVRVASPELVKLTRMNRRRRAVE